MALFLDFINAAATRTGSDPVTELNDGTPVGNTAGANYEQIIRAALTAYPWRWATKTATLVLLTGDVNLPWTYAYQLPTDLLKLRVVTVSGQRFDYERQADKLLCQFGGDYDLIAKYTWRVPETDWPATFSEAIIQHLEALFLRAVGERYQEAKDRQNDARLTLQAAKQEDSQNNPSRNPVPSPTLIARGAVSSTTSTLAARAE